MSSSLVFEPALVPQPLRGVSAYRLLKLTPTWKRICAEMLGKAAYRCEFCGFEPVPGLKDVGPTSATAVLARRGSVEDLHCHEVWAYDDWRRVATLMRFAAACKACHAAIHVGHENIVGSEDRAIEQLCRVNSITKAEAQEIVERSKIIWRERSARSWSVAVAKMLLTRYPELRPLDGRESRR